MQDESERSDKRKTIGALPNFLIIGAMKCGTTSLHHYLTKHSQVFMPREKELHFFIEQGSWSRGQNWYRSQFRPGFHACGEASTSYTCYPTAKGVPQRIHRLLGDIKLIYVVRDPIQRLLSHYLHNSAKHLEERSLDQIIEDTQSDYFWRSRYALQLEQYLEYFSLDRILIITQEDLLNERIKTLQQVFRFLDVSESIEFSVQRELHLTSLKRRPMPSIASFSAKLESNRLLRRSPRLVWLLQRCITYPFSIRLDKLILSEEKLSSLRVFFKEDMERLEQMTGRSFRSWEMLQDGPAKNN